MLQGKNSELTNSNFTSVTLLMNTMHDQQQNLECSIF